METGIRDEITGLINVMTFLAEADVLIRDHDGCDAVFLHFDVEDFKSLNQKFGFRGGNEFLRIIARMIEETFPEAVVSRINGDHFVLVTLDTKNVEKRAKELIDELRTMQKDISIEMNVGIYFRRADFDDVSTCMERAKMACSSIKGKYDRFLCYYDDSLDERINLRNHIIRSFHRALKQGWIEVYYQPEVRVMTEKICGFEALVRWCDPEYGVLSPVTFIEILEDTNLIYKLDLYVAEQVCKDLAYVLKHPDEFQPISVSTNLSRVDFQMADMFAEVEKLRRKYDIPIHLLHIEVTESALDSNCPSMQEQVEHFQSAGYEVWMDDFGSGYSSLNNLKDYKFDYLKIDMVFLKDFDAKPRSRVILSAIVNLAKELHMHTLAEGVETREQFEFLRSIGCEKVQGWLFGKPEPFWVDGKAIKMDRSFEGLAETIYFSKLGRVNLLSTNPLTYEEHPYQIVNQLGIAILEYNKGMVSYLYVNDAYRDYLHSIGYKDEQHSVDYLNKNLYQAGGDRVFLYTLFQKCADSMKEESMDCVFNGNLCNLKVRCIATRENAKIASFVIVATNLSQYEYVRRAEDMNTAIRQLIEIFIRIDVLSEKGILRNIYTDYMQNCFANMTVGNSQKLGMFADRYIHPDDREEFLKFYDFSTLSVRASHAVKEHVSGIFRTMQGDYDYVLCHYLLIPFQLNGKRLYLSCIKSADGIQGKIWERIKEMLSSSNSKET